MCCGIHNYTDWKPVLDDKLPETCCPTNTGDECDSSSAYQDGCLTKLAAKIEKEAIYLGIAGLGVAFIQVCYILCWQEVKKHGEAATFYQSTIILFFHFVRVLEPNNAEELCGAYNYLHELERFEVKAKIV